MPTYFEGVLQRGEPYVPKQQADAVLSQANPVSGTVYSVLPATSNVEVISASVIVTWGVTQPTPLVMIATVDSRVITFTKTNPVSAIPYEPKMTPENDITIAVLIVGSANSTATQLQVLRQLRGRSVQIGVAVTWAVTQPTPLVSRVRYAKW